MKTLYLKFNLKKRFYYTPYQRGTRRKPKHVFRYKDTKREQVWKTYIAGALAAGEEMELGEYRVLVPQYQGIHEVVRVYI